MPQPQWFLAPETITLVCDFRARPPTLGKSYGLKPYKLRLEFEYVRVQESTETACFKGLKILPYKVCLKVYCRASGLGFRVNGGNPATLRTPQIQEFRSYCVYIYIYINVYIYICVYICVCICIWWCKLSCGSSGT